MVKPSLDIALNAPDLTAFKNKMGEAGKHTGTIARQISKQFLEMNSEIAASAGAAGGRWALGWIGKAALVVGAIKLMGDAVSGIHSQLEKMLDIADKSSNTGFSPEFWQSWTAGAKGAEKQIDAFESALSHAYQSLKPALNPDWSVWDAGREKITAIETAMRGMRELFTTDQDFSGFELFKNAKSQDDKMVAVLTYMRQLQAIGENVAALDLAEKLFGSSFADKIRTNQLSIDQLLENIRTKSPDAFSNEIVMRAKELDNRLKDAWHTIDQNLHPSMETLDSLALSLKSTWADIVELMAKASKLLNPNFAGTNSVAVALSATGEPGLQTPILNGEVTQDQKITPDVARVMITGGTEQVPMPRRRPTDAPAPPKPEAGGVDRFETSAEGIERRIAALRAEAQSLDLSAGARDKSRIAAQLETVAMQANAAAGLGANVVTAEQGKRIDEVAAAYGSVSQAMEKAKVASDIDFGRKTAFLSSEDVSVAQQLKGIYGNDVPAALASTEAAALRANEAMRGIGTMMSSTLTSGLADILDGTKSVSDGFADMGKTIIRALENAAIKAAIVGPIMRSFSGGLGFADGGMINVGNQSFPKFADGGAIRGPGSGRSDSIPILASNGEFMVNAEATSRHRGLLEAINSNRLRGFADGGLVSDIATPSGGAMIGGQAVTVTNHVTVNGSAGTPSQNDDLVRKMGAQLEAQARQMVAKELRTQMKPGGIIKR